MFIHRPHLLESSKGVLDWAEAKLLRLEWPIQWPLRAMLEYSYKEEDFSIILKGQTKSHAEKRTSRPVTRALRENTDALPMPWLHQVRSGDGGCRSWATACAFSRVSVWDGTRWAAELPSQQIQLQARAGLLSLYYGEANKVLLLAAIKSKTDAFCWFCQKLPDMSSILFWPTRGEL